MKDLKKEILEEFVERGADLEHDRWARWQKYMFSKCFPHKIHDSLNAVTKQHEDIETGNLVIPKGLVERWSRQIDTTCADLPEKEKESDRKETRNYLPLLESAIDRAYEAGRENGIVEGYDKGVRSPDHTAKTRQETLAKVKKIIEGVIERHSVDGDAGLGRYGFADLKKKLDELKVEKLIDKK